MGQLTAPDSALLDPQTKQPVYMGKPQQVLDQTRQMLQSRTNNLDPGATSAPMPTIGKPSFQQAASFGATPGGANALSPGLNKAGKLATLLTSGLQGAMAGRAASEQAVIQSGGRRAGGGGMGFEAGYTLPWQRAEMGQKLAQGQAQTELLKAQSQMVPTPYGQMPAGLAKLMFPAMIRAGATTGAAETRADAARDVANIGVKGKLDAVALQTHIMQQKGGKFVPDIDPQTNQNFYHIFNPLGQEIGRSDVNVIPSLMTKTSSTVDYKQLDDGSIVALPKTTTTAPVIPQQQPGQAPQGRPQGRPQVQGGGGGARPVLDAQGNPIKGAGTSSKNAKWVSWDENGRMVAGPTSMARGRGIQEFAEVPAQEIRDITNARHAVTLMTKKGDPNKPESQGVLQLIDSLDKDGKLGVLASRWNSFMTSGVGTSPGDDPRIITLMNKNMLGDTAAMLAHFGASGGRSPQMLQHFLDLANARKMDGVTLRAGLLAMADYMQDRAQVPSANASQTQGGGFAAWKNAAKHQQTRP